MVIRIELRIFDQIVTSVSFGPKTGIPHEVPKTFKTIVCKTAPLAKLTPSYLFMKYDIFRQNADFFEGIECIIFRL